MAFTHPSLSGTREFLVAMFKAMFPDRNVGTPRSYHSRRLTVLAAAVTQLHRHVDSVQQDVMPDTASDDGPIDQWGAIVGTTRKAATPARKAAALRVRGTAGATAAIGDELIHVASQLTFQLASGVTIPAVAPFYIDADVVAADTGAATRLAALEVLEFVVTPANIETQAVLQKSLDEDGFDAEQFGAYRRRVLDTFSDPTAGGTQSDYVKWALEIEGVSYAYVYPNRAGFGTVDVVVLHTGTGAARIPTAGEVTAALAYLKTKAPAHIAGEPGALRVLTAVADPRDVEIGITPSGSAAHAFDWNDTTPPTVIAWTASTRTLQFSGVALPASLKAGHRLSLKGVASVQDGTEYKIEALSGATSVILEVAPAVDPVATDVIYSGGPLVTPIRDAIVAHMNGETVYAGRGGIPIGESDLEEANKSIVGLEVVAEGIGPANPAGRYGTWSGGLLRAALGQIAMFKTGVRNYSVVLPATDYEATDYTFPLDAQIGMLSVRSVLVRKG